MDSSFYLVVGLGKTGHSIARYLSRCHLPFKVFDTRHAPPDMSEFYTEFPSVDLFLGELPETCYEKLIAIISSPGVSLDEPFMQQAARLGIPIYGDIECLAQAIKAPVIAITGTNGKSTVTTLVGEMAKAAGIKVAVAGNIGTPVLDLLSDTVTYELWVLELSSFQLDLMTSLSPIAATILNITPDHLDRHHSVEAYIQSKQRVYHEARIQLYNRDDEQTYPSPTNHSGVSISFGLDAPSDGHWGLRMEGAESYLVYGDTVVLATSALCIKGRHNWANVLAACALAHVAGISFECMRVVLKQFTGLKHRSQWVRTINGVDWMNDSKGTNTGATISAIAGIGGSMQGRIVLIAGGQGKGADFTTLRTPVFDYVRSVVLIGEDAHHIEHALVDTVPIYRAINIEEAVIMAKAQAKPGDVVLLSPACASFDMFRDFNHRGEVFTSIVNAL